MNADVERRPAGSLAWTTERANWPHAASSRFHSAGGLRWHVQQTGDGPPVLLIHGTGASTHSWRALMPLLARRYTVIAADLPGHGFSERKRGQRLSLERMAGAVAALVEALEIRPALAVGHSAGAAILIRCCLDGSLKPDGLVAVNGALLPFRGVAGWLFPSLAKAMFLNPLAPWLIARSAADRDRVVKLIRDTGSELDDAGIDLYARLFASPAHVGATLNMMANWDLRGFARELSGLDVPLLLLAGEHDQAVQPQDAEQVARRIAGARVQRLPGLGHLAHEEDAEAVAASILAFARSTIGAADPAA